MDKIGLYLQRQVMVRLEKDRENWWVKLVEVMEAAVASGKSKIV